jgi:hypothetical protein
MNLATVSITTHRLNTIELNLLDIKAIPIPKLARLFHSH